MAITLHQKTKFRGRSTRLTADASDLSNADVGAHPSSLELDAGDAALFFRHKDWDGGCIYRRGQASIEDLGSGKDGGQFGFGNTIASVRVTPFSIRLNVTVVSTPDFVLPGAFVKPARTQVDEVVAQANTILAGQQALIELVVSHFNVRQSDHKFDIAHPKLAWYLPQWKVAGELDLVIANSSAIGAALGVTKPPLLGQVVLLPATIQLLDANGSVVSVNLATQAMGIALAHELCHFLGVHHPSGQGNANNLMSAAPTIEDPSGLWVDPPPDSLFLTETQIENVHATLSRHPARRLNRQGD
jgi:hypothetical protein